MPVKTEADVPALLAEIERLRAENEVLKDQTCEDGLQHDEIERLRADLADARKVLTEMDKIIADLRKEPSHV